MSKRADLFMMSMHRRTHDRNVSRLAVAVRFMLLLLVSLATPDLQGQEAQTLTVVSYNIHHAEGVDGQLDVPRIAKVLTGFKADLIVLQEVDRKTQRVKGRDLAAELAEQLEMQMVFGKSIEFGGGEYGNAILSRYPIEESETRRLPKIGNGEQRTVLWAQVRVPGLPSPLHVLGTHFDHRPEPAERLASARQVNEWIKDRRGPALLVGDLNAPYASEVLETLGQEWRLANSQPLPTVPVAEPMRQIDFILVRPREAWEIVEVQVGDEAVASDHRPIAARLRWSLE